MLPVVELTVTVPFTGGVVMDTLERFNPLLSVSFAGTLMTTGVSSLVDATSSFAIGGMLQSSVKNSTPAVAEIGQPVIVYV